MERFAGRYALIRPLGLGGMGAVHLALDLATGRECALKRLEPGVLFGTPDSLRQEFDVLSRLRHPAVVGVYDLGFAPDGSAFYTMEYVPGVPAPTPVRDWHQLSEIGAQVSEGLEALHAAGILHGDLKPSNVLVVAPPDGDSRPLGVRLVDFGLAGLLDAKRQPHRGTHGFAAPEVVAGVEPGIPSDLYGLGATLYALATSRAPAQDGRTALGLPLEEAGLPAPFIQLILRLLAPAGERPASARDVRRELERIDPRVQRGVTERLESENLIGRAREMARIERWLGSSSSAPRGLLLVGEMGVGKSALLRAVAARAALAGRYVVRVACSECATPTAAMDMLLRQLMAAGNSAQGNGGEAMRNGPPAMADAGRWIRESEAQGRSVVVLMDECECLDASARAALRALLLQAGTKGSRWLLALRSGAESDEEELLAEAAEAQTLKLGPLDREATAELVAARLYATPPAELVDALWQRSGGHPGMLVESLRSATAAGVLRETEHGYVVDRAALETPLAPASFEDVLVARLSGLDDPAQGVAEALAVLDRPATTSELDALVPHVACGVDELRKAGLATIDDRGLIGVRPVGLGRRIRDRLVHERRVALHAAALALPELTDEERFAHLAGSGRPREALAAAELAWARTPSAALARDAAEVAGSESSRASGEWHERAGRALLDHGHHVPAVRHLSAAVAAGSDEAEVRARRWFWLSTAHTRAGQLEEVEQEVARTLAESPSDGLRARAMCNDVARLMAQGRIPDAIALASDALSIAVRSGDDEARGIAAFNLGCALFLARRIPEAEVAAIESAEASNRAGTMMLRLRALNLRATTVAAGLDSVAAERLYREALREAHADGLGLPAQELLANLAALLTEQGRWMESREAVAHAQALALEGGRTRDVALATANLAMLDTLMGRIRSGTRLARSAVRLTRRHHPSLEPAALRALGRAFATCGLLHRAERVLARAMAGLHEHPTPGEMEWESLELGNVLAARGQWDRAGEIWDRAAAAASEPSLAVRMLEVAGGRAAVRRRDGAVARTRAAAAAEWLEAHPAGYLRAQHRLLEAECALLEGKVEAGIAAAREALAHFDSLPAPADRAAAALDLARLARRFGLAHHCPVVEWASSAAAGFERLGNRRGREQALALTVEWLLAESAGGPGIHGRRNLIEEVSRLLDSLPDLRQLGRRAMRLAVQQLGAERGVLLLYDPATGELDPLVEHGAVDPATRHRALGFSRRAVERVTTSGGSILVSDAPSDPEASSPSVKDLGLRSILCVPLFASGSVIGAVYVDDSRRSDAFDDTDRGLLEGFAHLMATAIERSRAEQEMRAANESLVGENLSLRREVAGRFQPGNFVGHSVEMQKVLELTELAAASMATVLLSGENGTGKELVARIVHHTGKRRLKPFVMVNCGAIPETLLESELFGIMSNVATGVHGRDGRFVQADGGTLFLDEVGDMPLQQQVALLSVLSNREVTPVGGSRPVPVDVRIIAATNRNLKKLVDEGRFRLDLYYRLNVFPIAIPPLRDRKADIPLLASHFAAHFARQSEREVPTLSPRLVAVLMQCDWHGNVRELQNYIEQLMAMTPGKVLHPQPLPQELLDSPRRSRGRRLTDKVRELEIEEIRLALERAEGNQTRAARDLGIPEQSLRYRLRKYGLVPTRPGRRIRRKRR